jgi:hypothetical protein
MIIFLNSIIVETKRLPRFAKSICGSRRKIEHSDLYPVSSSSPDGV